MNLPQYTAENALYRSKNVYREYCSSAEIEPDQTVDMEYMVLPATRTLCAYIDPNTRQPVNKCNTTHPCNPECSHGEQCCLGYTTTTIKNGEPYHDYYLECKNVANDNLNCGVCGHSCGSETCDKGICCPTGQNNMNGICCAQGQSNCNGSCVDLKSDMGHCGTCGQSCPSGMICSDGVCNCPGGQTVCSGVCSDTGIDPLNCGVCGNICTQGDTCINGYCIPPTSLLTNVNQNAHNYNYIFYANDPGSSSHCCITETITESGSWGSIVEKYPFCCINIEGVSVNLLVGQEMMTNGTGFSLQINAFPPASYYNNPAVNPNDLIFMQFVLAIELGVIFKQIQYWDSNGIPYTFTNAYGNPTNNSDNTISENQNLNIILNYDSTTGNITDADFIVTDTTGTIIVPLNGINIQVPPEYQLPISSFTLNVVGPGGNNMTATTFQSGGGTITYDTNNGQQLCIYSIMGGTGETSNIIYEELSAGCGAGTTLIQTFSSPTA